MSVRVIGDDDDDNEDNNDDDDGVDDGGEVDDGWLSVRVIGHRPSRPSVLPSLTCHCLLPFHLFPPFSIFPRPFLLFPAHCCPLPFKLFHRLFLAFPPRWCLLLLFSQKLYFGSFGASSMSASCCLLLFLIGAWFLLLPLLPITLSSFSCQ